VLEGDVTSGPIEEDDGEDDVGSMSMPADPSSVGGARKKQKGSFVAVNRREVVYQDPLVLPTKNCTWSIPAADRYFKSFMHSDKFHHHHKVCLLTNETPPVDEETIGLTIW
jgi:hypothetical protein